MEIHALHKKHQQFSQNLDLWKIYYFLAIKQPYLRDFGRHPVGQFEDEREAAVVKQQHSIIARK